MIRADSGLGIPAVNYGPGDPMLAHADDERCPISQISAELRELEQALAALAQVKSNVDSGIFRPLQEAAVRALAVSPEWIAARNRVYQARMEILLEALHAAGMAVSRPRATLYAWAQVPPGWQSEPFAMALLKQTGVVLAPGPFFGPGGEGFVRFVFGSPRALLEEALERMREALLRL